MEVHHQKPFMRISSSFNVSQIRLKQERHLLYYFSGPNLFGMARQEKEKAQRSCMKCANRLDTYKFSGKDLFDNVSR